jgi:hypothetical protein
MNVKQISMIAAGATLIYAGFLSLADDLPVSIGLMVAGGILIALPLWKVFAHPVNLTSSSAGQSVKTGKRNKKRHLRLVKPDEEDRPTYH